MIRFEWGLEGARALAEVSDCLVIVDVMSFSTCVSVAVDRGAVIIPCAQNDHRAEALAKQHGAVLASPVRQKEPGAWSLSPTALSTLPAGLRLVLPSLNGSTITQALDDFDGEVFVAALRNRSATARRCAGFKDVGIVGCGERWPGGALRPAYEDLVGAGALVAALAGQRSTEASAAEAVFAAHASDLEHRLAHCVSGRELDAEGFALDLAQTAALDVGAQAARYRDGSIMAAAD